MRYVSCRDENGSVADESACATLPRPVAKEECSVTPCGQWKALDWSSVSQWIIWNWRNWGNTEGYEESAEGAATWKCQWVICQSWICFMI